MESVEAAETDSRATELFSSGMLVDHGCSGAIPREGLPTTRESIHYNCYFWAWVECASASARRKASKSAQMRVVVLLSSVLMTGSPLFDE
jgi:hypothetical protein